MADSVNEVIDMARALSEGEFEDQFQQHFQGELGQLASYLEAVRQTLPSLSVSAQGSRELIPKAADMDQNLVDRLLATLRKFSQ